MDITSIVPISEVHLLKGVPLDNSYNDTLTFVDSTAQYLYFKGKVKTGCDFYNLRPVDLNNKLNLSINAYSVYDCNYLMFKNANFNSKWLYAFITDIKFVSINVCQISFELDIMQTWYFDYQLLPSFVVREHTNDDTIGSNLVPENVETGEYVSNGVENLNYSDMNVCVLTSLKSDMTPASGKCVNNIYSGLDAITGNSAHNVGAVNSVLQTYIQNGKEDAIAAVYQYPAYCEGSTPTSATASQHSIQSNLTSLDGYVPKNNKLFTYPYNFLAVSNNEGKGNTYRYEQFTNPADINFTVIGVAISTPCLFLYPTSYRGIGPDYDSGLTISNFPQCAWAGDAFKAYLAQNKGALALSTLANVGSAVGGAISGNPIGAVAGIAGIAGEIAKVYDHQQIPPTIHGQVNTDCLNSGMNRIQFSFYKMSVKHQFAEIIDDFFSMYGYKTNRVKTPNRTGRAVWNYVETRNCQIVGDVPFNDMSKIKSIYNSGVTFWHNPDYVGCYTMNNPIMS